MKTSVLELENPRLSMRDSLGNCCDSCACSADRAPFTPSRLKTKDDGDCCSNGGAGGGTARSTQKIIKAIMAYQFEPLIHRMIDKHGWTEAETRGVFEDTKRFLALCAISKGGMVPSPKIDEMWHNFILFTPDYLKFCLQYAGRFIHHVPRLRGEKNESQKIVSADSNPVQETLKLARSIFGDLSEHWTYKLNAICFDSGQEERAHTCEGPVDSARIHDPHEFKAADCQDCAPVACGHR